MKAKIYEVLTKEQQDEIYEMAIDIKKRIKNKEITYAQGFNEIKYGKRFKDWINGIDNIDEVYSLFIPKLHERLLKAYKAIIEPLIDKGVLIVSNAGTQLGVVRDNGIIGWDDDLDLLMDVKDFNRYKSEIRWRAFKHGWFLKTRDWLNNDFMPKKGNNYIWVKLFSINGIKLDFGKFTSRFFPFIDIFPAIRVKYKLTQEDNEELTIKLVDYYDSCNRRVISNLINNKRFLNDFPSYHSKLLMLDKNEECSINKKEELSNILNKHYSSKGEMLFQINVASPIFETFDYTKRNNKEILKNDKSYKFIYADNYEDHFKKEYKDWETPRRTHSHFLLPWFFKFK